MRTILISQNSLFIFVYTIQKIYYNLKYTLFSTDLLFSKYINNFRTTQSRKEKKITFYYVNLKEEEFLPRLG